MRSSEKLAERGLGFRPRKNVLTSFFAEAEGPYFSAIILSQEEFKIGGTKKES